jgi:Flp pilus assembly protein TadD
MIKEQRFIFQRSYLDIPLLLFVASQIIATILSLDFRTSLLGFYSRFNGGFMSIFCYALLYWTFVSNMDKKDVYKSIQALLASSVLVSLYGIAQHFGIDKDVWVQDVQNRIFSTLGQPNWLAAWVVALLPFTWAQSIHTSLRESDATKQSLLITYGPIALSTLLFITLLFTKSRSGILGFGISFGIFCLLFVIARKKATKQSLSNENHQRYSPLVKSALLLVISYTLLIVLIGTPWKPSIPSLFEKSSIEESHKSSVTSQTSLETGGTESGEIRKIVWEGAIDIWKHYPLFGSGVETFAFSYYQFKPAIHNYTSEWDYLYNKAHNEYLNYLATTGSIGFLSYLALIFGSLFELYKNSKKEVIGIGLLSGYISILVTNFFGFSVVPVSLLFFLIPAFSVALAKSDIPESKKKSMPHHTIGIVLVVSCTLFTIWKIGNYWYADIAYANGRNLNAAGDPVAAGKELEKAVDRSSYEAIYWDELAEAHGDVAVYLSEQGEDDTAKRYAKSALAASSKSLELSPANVNLKRNRAALLTKLSAIDTSYLLPALALLKEAKNNAPTDPKLRYSLAAAYYRVGDLDMAIQTMNEAVEMKKDYKDARYALALMYVDAEKKDEAIVQFQYILDKIDPKSEVVKKELEELQ